jgi:type VI secretion system protein ImpF
VKPRIAQKSPGVFGGVPPAEQSFGVKVYRAVCYELPRSLTGVMGGTALDSQHQLTPSLLDRLVDDEPDMNQEALSHRLQDLRDLKECIARDLEDMLNTRREALDELPEEFVETNRSLLVYGLPDFSSFNLLSSNDRNRLGRAIERAIVSFEPRLQRPSVKMESPNQSDQLLHFRVDALLRIAPAPEPVGFDTILQLGTQQYVVKGQD